MKNETTIIGSPKSGKIGVTDDAVVVTDGRRFFGFTEKISADEAAGRGVEIREGRDSAKENLVSTSTFISSGVFSSPDIEKADVRLPNPSGKDLEIKVEQSTRSGTRVVDKLYELFPTTRESGGGGSDSAMDQLKKQYVEGEITEEELEDKKEVIRE